MFPNCDEDEAWIQSIQRLSPPPPLFNRLFFLHYIKHFTIYLLITLNSIYFTSAVCHLDPLGNQGLVSRKPTMYVVRAAKKDWCGTGYPLCRKIEKSNQPWANLRQKQRKITQLPKMTGGSSLGRHGEMQRKSTYVLSSKRISRTGTRIV